MSFPQSSHAYADMRHPRAWGFCDRCGFRYLRDNLNWQFDYRGLQLQNLRLLVDHRCLDEPQPQLRPVIIGPDPVPIVDARPGFQATQQGFTPVFSILELVDGDILPGPTINFGIGNDGGVAILTAPAGWPTNSLLVPAGGVWNNGGAIGIVPGIVPNPGAQAFFFGSLNAPTLLAMGGGNFPTTDPRVLNQFWNNGGELAISLGI
jgi:hypothetical protein